MPAPSLLVGTHPVPGALANRTRRAPSIPRKLLAERKPYLLPVYAALLASDLAREGIANSGSYRFADHIYRGKPSGRWFFGRALDALLLRFPSARSFQARHAFARDAVVRFVRGHPAVEPGLRVLSVPCGIARELVGAAITLRSDLLDTSPSVAWLGLDLDPEPLALSHQLVARHGLQDFAFLEGDALDSLAYPSGVDVIVSTGLGEFLPDEALGRFYRNCWNALRTGGWFVTSATQRHPVTDYLLRNVGELHTWYRTPSAAAALVRGAGFHVVEEYVHPTGLQTFIVGVRP